MHVIGLPAHARALRGAADGDTGSFLGRAGGSDQGSPAL